MPDEVKYFRDLTENPSVTSLDYFIGVKILENGESVDYRYSLDSILASTRKKIDIESDGVELVDDFFENEIIEISMNTQTYIVGLNFSLNKIDKKITGINGLSFNSGNTLIAKI